jgi:hypothetical protein
MSGIEDFTASHLSSPLHSESLNTQDEAVFLTLRHRPCLVSRLSDGLAGSRRHRPARRRARPSAAVELKARFAVCGQKWAKCHVLCSRFGTKCLGAALNAPVHFLWQGIHLFRAITGFPQTHLADCPVTLRFRMPFSEIWVTRNVIECRSSSALRLSSTKSHATSLRAEVSLAHVA